MTLLKTKYKNISPFSSDYINALIKVLKDIDQKKLIKITDIIEKAVSKKKNIFVCGNGGSAAIANHFICDYLKYMKTNNNLSPQVISLSSSLELITAISNDISYDDIFSYQLEALGKRGDLLIAISSSGNSKNIINVIKLAKQKQIISISFTGFKGGYVKKSSNLNLHFNINNYGLSEDSHHIFMHIICQFIRQKHIKNSIFKQVKF